LRSSKRKPLSLSLEVSRLCLYKWLVDMAMVIMVIMVTITMTRILLHFCHMPHAESKQAWIVR
jgi:hypothetical protein